MKTVKKVLAIILCVVLAALCFTACHKKNETAVKIGEYKFTAAYYACALVYADGEARQKVEEDFEKQGKSTDDIDYMSQKVEGKKYEKWVKDKAIDILKEVAGYMALCKENKFELTDDDKATAENYVKNYWEYFGYDTMFENNGVSKETFLKFTTDSYYSQVYFDNVYGKEGTKAISEEELKKTLVENFVLVDRISVDISSLTDDEIAENKELLNGYLELLNKGTDFAEIFVDYDTQNGDDARSVEAGDGVESAKDPNAEILGDSESSYPCDYYDELKGMAIGESKIIETATEIVLVKKLDISGESFYLTNYDDTLRSTVVGDEADDAAKKKADELGVKTIAKAINLFKVKNIKYDTEE